MFKFFKKKLIADDQQPLFQEQQSKIYPLIGRELIALTPEHWESAVLELITVEDGVRHSIFSDAGQRDIVIASMELFEQTRKLELLFREYNCMWEEARFRIWLDEEKNWKFSVNYKYPA
jgi:hypothetical protein